MLLRPNWCKNWRRSMELLDIDKFVQAEEDMAKIGQRPVLDYCYGEVEFILSRWTGQGELIRPPDLRGRIITDHTLDTLRKMSCKIPHKRGIECEQSTLRLRARVATPSAAFAVGRIKEAQCRVPHGAMGLKINRAPPLVRSVLNRFLVSSN